MLRSLYFLCYPSLYLFQQSVFAKFSHPHSFHSNPAFCAPFTSSFMSYFSEDRFQTCVRDFEAPNLEGWSFVAECEGLKIYKQLASVSSNKGLYTYKVVGTLKGVEASLAYSVYMDLDYRRQWDALAPEQLSVRPLPPQFSNIPHLECIYWRVNFPMLLSDRDYIFLRESRKVETDGEHPRYIVMAEAFSSSDEPPVRGVIRVAEYNQTVIFAPSKENHQDTQIYMIYFDNPGGNIPSAVINWAVSSGVPAFLSKLKRACHQYEMPAVPPAGIDPKGVVELRGVIDASFEKSFHL